jgi:hypothetical protein
VVGATISAYAVSAAGAVSSTALATATTDSNGSYSLMLPASAKGDIVKLVSTGGTFTDDASGATVNAPTLDALVPNASGTISAQLTALTTFAAQLALQEAQLTNGSPSSAGVLATEANTLIGLFFGGQQDILGTPLLNVTTAGCASDVSQASIDATVLLESLDWAAAIYSVTPPALILALAEDYISDKSFNGLANGANITVPSSNGGPAVNLCTIEDDCAGSTGNFAKTLLGAAIQWTGSAANVCGVQLSSATTGNMNASYGVSGTVTGLSPGAMLTLNDNLNDPLTVSAASFVFGRQLSPGSTYEVSITTQPSGQTCTVSGGDQGNGSGTISGNVSSIAVACTGGTTGAPLNNPNGLVYNEFNGLFYLANAGANQILVLSGDDSSAFSSLSQEGIITQDISNPTRLAIDASGRYLYVTNGHQGSAGWVTIYDTQSSNAEVAKITDSHIYGPLGVAVDSNLNMYVASNSGNYIAYFTPTSTGDPSAYTFVDSFSQDYAGNQFSAPGALFIFNLGGEDFLLVGTGGGLVLLYAQGLTGVSTPVGKISTNGCPSAPAGPTGFARGPGLTTQSFVYVANFYGAVLGYQLSDIMGSGTCPTVIDTTSGNHSPEGLASDHFARVFVVNAGSNTITGYTGALAPLPYTYP